MKVWNLVMTTYFGGDGMQIVGSMSFKTKDAAIDQMNFICDANGFIFDYSDLRDHKHNIFDYYTNTGREYMFAIIETELYSKPQVG